ncbi:MAG: hypothetical protein Q8O89_01045 [Nanoarchaeota archaeon]|nr:hypothetical protein [Nanoarchaeota archaeon]
MLESKIGNTPNSNAPEAAFEELLNLMTQISITAKSGMFSAPMIDRFSELYGRHNSKLNKQQLDVLKNQENKLRNETCYDNFYEHSLLACVYNY